MTPPRQPGPPPIPRNDSPTPRPIPIRPLTLEGLGEKVDHVDRRVDTIARDLTDHEVAEKDARELLGLVYIGLRESKDVQREQAGQIGSIAGTALTTKGEVSRLASAYQRHETAIRELREAVGTPPDPAAAMRASHSDTTPEELAKRVDLGTGLFREQAETRALVMTLWRRGKWAFGAAVVAQQLPLGEWAGAAFKFIWAATGLGG